MRYQIAARLVGHRYDSMSQDSGSHCVCGSDSRFEQAGGDKPWASIEEHLADLVLGLAKPPTSPLSQRFKEGERICVPGYEGSYPAHSKNQWGIVEEIEPTVVMQVQETLMVRFDNSDFAVGINPDVVGHGSDWRWANTDPMKELNGPEFDRPGWKKEQ